MILGRLTKAIREQNWFAVALEVCIVVLGIVIGFQVTAWGNERAMRAEEKELLHGLHAEFTVVLSDLQEQVGKHRRIEREVATVLEALGRARSRNATVAAVADTVLAWALVPTTTQFSQGVLQGTLTTGRLQLIRDAELRTALSEWEGVLADVTEDEVASREIVVYQLEPLLWRIMDIRSVRTYELLLGTLSPSEMGAVSEVPVNAELIGALSTRLYWQQHTILEFEQPQEEAQRILDLIERSLGVTR
jgi:hypothetical protein